MWQLDSSFWDVLAAAVVVLVMLSWPLVCVLLGRIRLARRAVSTARPSVGCSETEPG
ncbi:hypothetical protein J2S53_002920 [Actinopolyspora lacussalsi]|uniref:hypothetical protein n=1 Tax=Actinopolyspora righensis TaxID=995060 RepID=UPI0015870996|nr:hypothetical protein [Actinopolyspora righensis]MDP9642975.1 hypothetical protein [Actinopolyspora lacussalsi]